MGVDKLRTGGDPRGLCLHEVECGDDTLFKADIGVAEVLFGALHVARGGGELFAGLVHFVDGLIDLQLHLLARLLRFESLDHRLGACGVTLVGAFPPRREGHTHQHADVVHARKLLLETVVCVRIRDEVVGRQCDGGQHLGQCDLLLFAVNLRGQLKAL